MPPAPASPEANIFEERTTPARCPPYGQADSAALPSVVFRDPAHPFYPTNSLHSSGGPPFQFLTQHLHPAVQIHAHRIGGQAGLLRDLWTSQAFHQP